MNLDELVIKQLGYDSYEKGKNYKKSYLRYMNSHDFYDGSKIHMFDVESESYNLYYDVYIFVKNNRIIKNTCSCLQYKKTHTCKHISACILNYSDKLFEKALDEYEVSNKILDIFNETKNDINAPKEQINLELELDFSFDNIIYKLSVGTKNKYVINSENKFESFMDAYEDNEKYNFGVKFTYDPTKHYFSDEDKDLLIFLYGYKKNKMTYYGYYYKNNIFELNEREANMLFEKLKSRKFKIKGYGFVNGIINDIPTSLNLDFKDDIYNLSIEDIYNYNFIDEDYKYVIYKNMLYVLPNIYTKLFKSFYSNSITELKIKKENVDNLKNGLLRKVKDNIIISENVKDIVISSKPVISLYFDLLKDKIDCKIKLDYNGNVIDYFDNNSIIIRDDVVEKDIINELLLYNFIIKNNKIYLENLDDIGYFISNGLSELTDKYKVYTTKKIDNMNLIKKSKIESNFSIGKDGIMSYSFNADNINLDELGNILSSLNNKKRYYKLKNGNLLDLEENKDLLELNGIVKDLELSNKDLESGNIVIPKFRAFYIDSLKNNKYKTINTDYSFDEFINNFKKYKNVDIKFDKKDEEILRGYQKEGIKWLYTLYKCDLGGILADEMGLGKSIQTICFIKQILKEKKDAKILIVCPTSLVYNWKKEFDKFGSELKYVTVADNKEKRLEVINNIDDYNIFITSYGLIRNDNDEYEKINFELCVIDEAQTIKNYQAGMTKEVKKIKARTKIALTGTPLENSVLELWSIFDFILPGYLNSIIKFKENYGIKDIDEESIGKLTNLNYQIKPFMLRRKKKDVSKELPDKVENNIYLELPEMQKALYLKVLNETKKEMDELIKEEGFSKARFKILQLLMKLRQICVDPSIIYENYNYDSIKLEKLTEIVKDYIKEGHKILIFSSFKRVIDKVEKNFKKDKITSYVISGEVKSKDRMDMVEKFNKDDTNCFLITLKSGGTGLNLTGADIVIHLDIWWNPQVENQATDRAHRIGQKNKVTVIKLITKGTIEEKILELQDKKKILSENLIEGKDNSTLINSLSEKEMKTLLSLGEDE